MTAARAFPTLGVQPKPSEEKRMDKFAELNAFLVRATGVSADEWIPLKKTPWDLMEALWPLNEIFRAKLSRLENLRYRSRFEIEADEAIIAFAESGELAWAGITSGAWRVLHERHHQMLVTCAANAASDNRFMWTVPQQLAKEHWTAAAVLEWYLRMKLPWPPRDKGLPELPEGNAPGPMRLQ